MGTQKLSEGIKRKVIGWELIGEKYEGKDFNLGDEVILNIFYDRSNACNEAINLQRRVIRILKDMI